MTKGVLSRSTLKRKRVLVAGGAGFIGSHLIDRLLAQGDEVICADNLFTGSKRNTMRILISINAPSSGTRNEHGRVKVSPRLDDR